MKVLLIHTCGVKGSVAVADAGGTPVVLASAVLPPRTFSEGLMPAIREVLQQAALAVSDLGAVGVVTGPGSFTGVRTGLSVAKGLCEALEIPLIGVSRLALLAGRKGKVRSVLDAGRGDFYYGRYREGRCEKEALVSLQELRDEVGEGEGVVLCEEMVAEALAGWDLERRDEPFAGEALESVIAGLANGVDGVMEDASYLRRTDAEIFAKPMVGRIAE